MKIDVQVSEVNINIPRLVSKVRDERFWLYAAQQWHRHYYKYVPYREGELANQVAGQPGKYVSMEGKQGYGEIHHTAPYAHYIYNGHFNFRKEPHPNATRQWDKAAAQSQLPALTAELQAYIDSGRLDFD